MTSPYSSANPYILSSNQKASHRRLLDRIKAGDEVEANTSKSNAATAAGGKRALRGGNSAMGLMNSSVNNSSLNQYNGSAPPMASSVLVARRATISGMGVGGISPLAASALLSPISRTGTASTPARPQSVARSAGRSPPPTVGDVGRLLVSVNANDLRGLSSTQQSATSGQLSLPDATAIATLSTGIAIAVQQSSFEELAEHGVWQVSGTNSCHLPLAVIEGIFKAKLRDTYSLRHGIGGGGRATIEAPSSLADNASASDRLMRFVELVSNQCQGIYFDLSGVGLGRTALELAVDALIEDHHRGTRLESAMARKADDEERRRKQLQQQQAAAGAAQSLDRNGKKANQTVRIIAADPSFAGEQGGEGSYGRTTSQQSGSASNTFDPFAVHFDFPSYAVVDFSRNMAGEEGGYIIARLLAENESVVALTLRSMGLLNHSATCEMFNTIAYRNMTLTCLDLSGVAGNPRNNLGGETGMVLGDMLRHNQVLTTLRLGDCGLEPAALANLFVNTMTHVALSELDVSGNKIDKHPVCMALAAMLAFGNCRLEKLVLNGCSIGDNALKIIAKGFNQDLNTATDDATQNDIVALRRLHPNHNSGSRDANRVSMGNTPLKNHGTTNSSAAAALGLSSSTQQAASACLKTLQLCNNAFGCIGLATLATKIAKMPSLETLDLSENRLMAQGTDAEGIRLPQTIVALDSLLITLAGTVPTLVELNLSNCKLSLMPTRIETFLTKSSLLKKLRLSHNAFGDFGARMLGEAMFHRSYVLRSKAMQAAKASELLQISANSAPANASPSKGSPAQKSEHSSGAFSNGVSLQDHPLELLAVDDCGITPQGMIAFLQHMSEAPRVQITAGGIIVGFRTPTIAPHEGLGGLGGGGLSASTNQRPEGSPEGPQVPEAGAAPALGTSGDPTVISLTHLPKSLNAPEVIVPSGYTGLAVLALKITQPSWTKWIKDLIDLLCHIPCLEGTDLGRHTPEELTRGLTYRKKLRIDNSVPKYKMQVELVKREENRLFEARDQIQDEIKRTEKAKESYKSARDRQKALLTQIKTDISATTDELAAQNQLLEAADQQITVTQQYFKEKEEAMLIEGQRMQRKIEAVQNMRKDIESQMKSIGIKQRKHKELVQNAEQNLKNGSLLLRRSSSNNDSTPIIINNPSHQFHHGSGPSSPSMTARDRESMSLTKSMSMAFGNTTSLVRSGSVEGLHALQSEHSLAVGTGLTPTELQALALEAELREVSEELENEKDAAAFYKRQLDDLNRRIALLTGDTGGSKKKGKKSEAKKVDKKVVPVK